MCAQWRIGRTAVNIWAVAKFRPSHASSPIYANVVVTHCMMVHMTIAQIYARQQTHRRVTEKPHSNSCVHSVFYSTHFRQDGTLNVSIPLLPELMPIFANIAICIIFRRFVYVSLCMCYINITSYHPYSRWHCRIQNTTQNVLWNSKAIGWDCIVLCCMRICTGEWLLRMVFKLVIATHDRTHNRKGFASSKQVKSFAVQAI